jgi:anti-sigma factor RsiW
MIVKFSTRAGALTMHGDAAVALLKAMGHSGSVPGAILAGDLPGALASLRRHLEELAHAPPPPQAEVSDEDEDRERAPPVTLHMRALPLIDMIETAIARNSDLMWERG